MRKFLRKPPKKTVMVPTGCCIFICHNGLALSVIPRPDGIGGPSFLNILIRCGEMEPDREAG